MAVRQYRDILIKDSLLSESERMSVYGSSRITFCQKPNGEPGREYIYKRRLLDPFTVSEFRLGFVPFDVDWSFSGSCFCGRVMIPIFTPSGDLLALSFRPVDDGVDPKYWNESFDKGRNLFGLNLAKYAMKRTNTVVLVEGQFDVMSMHSQGIKNTAGLLGGAFTPMHALLVKRYAENIVLLMDSDGPGEKHIQQAEEALKVSGNVAKFDRVLKWAVARLPRDSDPDSYLMQHGGGAMRRLLADSMASAGMEVPKEFKK